MREESERTKEKKERKKFFSPSLLRSVDPLFLLKNPSFLEGSAFRVREKERNKKRKTKKRSYGERERDEKKNPKKNIKIKTPLTSVPLPPLIAPMYLSTSSAQSWRWLTPDSL